MVEMKSTNHAIDTRALQKVRLYTGIRSANAVIALLRFNDLFIESFQVFDVKML